MIQLTLTLKMTTAQVVETSVAVNNNSPIQDYVHPDDQTQPFDTWKNLLDKKFVPLTILQYNSIETTPVSITRSLAQRGKQRL